MAPKGIITAILFVLSAVLACAALGTPVYKGTFRGIQYWFYPLRFCYDIGAGDECFSLKEATEHTPQWLSDPQANFFKFITAMLFFTLFASIAGIVVSILEHLGKTRKFHLIIVSVIVKLLSFIVWTAMAGNYHANTPSDLFEGKKYSTGDLGPSPALAIVTWILSIVAIVVSVVLKGRETEGVEPGVSQASSGYRYNAA